MDYEILLLKETNQCYYLSDVEPYKEYIKCNEIQHNLSSHNTLEYCQTVYEWQEGDIIQTVKYLIEDDYFNSLCVNYGKCYYEVIRTTDKSLFIRQLKYKNIICFYNNNEYKDIPTNIKDLCLIRKGEYANNKIRRIKRPEYTGLIRIDSYMYIFNNNEDESEENNRQ
jgi:hypothetical protein